MKYSKYIHFFSAFSDLIILNFCFNFVFCYLRGFGPDCMNTTTVGFFVFINFAWLISANVFNAYKADRQIFKKKILFTYIKTVVFFFFLFLLFFQVIKFNYYPRDDIKYLFVVFLFSIVLWRFLFYYFFQYYRTLGYNYRNVIIVGYNETAEKLKDYFDNNPWAGYRFNGFFTYKESDNKNIVGDFSAIEDFVGKNKVNEIYIMTNDIQNSIYKIISSITGKYPVKIRFVPDLSDFSYRSIKLVDYDMVPVIKIQHGPLNFWYNRWIKRLFDVVISLTVIVFVLSWVVLLLFVIDYFTDREGVFFTQLRSGLNNKSFTVIKFRTMRKNNEAHIKQVTVDDKRVTKVGRFLRKTSMDELPQFFNVLVGQMSIIGPRPHMLIHTEKFKSYVNKFMIRHIVKPGITGYAQVRGLRGEIKLDKDIKERIKLDIFYIENWSLSLDTKIIFLTLFNILKGDEKAY